tara:strand:- start:419 stop:8185 length:7767 start_codon:yes stop_codon:yes gene_type:complete
MPRYEANNQVYNIPDDQVDLFIQTNPEAILLEEEVKIEGAPNVDANVAPKPVIASESLASSLEGISLELPEETDETKYENAVRITDQEKLNLEDQVKDISFKPVKEYLGSGSDYLKGFAKPIMTQPYEAELKQARVNLKAQGETDPALQDVYTEARKIILDNKLQDLEQKKRNDYIKTLPEETRIKLGDTVKKRFVDGTYQLDELKSDLNIALDQLPKSSAYKNVLSFNDYLSAPVPKAFPEVQEFLKLRNKLEKDINEVNKRRAEGIESPVAVQEIQKLQQQVEEKAKNIVTLENGVMITKDFYDLYNKSISEVKEKYNFIENTSKKLTDLVDKQEGFKLDISWLRKNYNFLDQLGAIVTKTGAASAAGILRFGTDLVNIADYKELNQIAEISKQVQNKAMKDLEEDYAPQVAFEDAFNSPSDFGKFYMQSMAGQIPVLAQLTLGYGGIGLIGAGSYGQKINDIETLDEQRGSETGNFEKRLTALGFGAAEAGLGSLNTLKIFNTAFSNLDDISAKAFFDGAKSYLKAKGPDLLEQTTAEFVLEGSTIFAQNSIEVFRGEMNLQNVFDNVDEGAVTGGLLGITLGGVPILKGAALASMSDYNTMSEFRENESAISILNNEIEGMDKRTKAYKTRVDLINNLTESNSDILNKIENDLATKLIPEGFELYKLVTSAQENIRLEVKSILERTDLNNSEKAKLLSIYENRFSELANQRKEFKNDFQNVFSVESKKVKNKYRELAKNKLTTKGVTDQKQIDKEAQKLYNIDKLQESNEQASKAAKKLAKRYGAKINYKFSENNAELLAIARQDIDTAIENGNVSKAKGDKIFNDLKDNVNSGRSNGAFISLGNKNYTVLVSQTNALNNGKTRTPIHELGHVIFMESLGIDEAGYNNLATTILDYLKKNNESAARRLSAQTAGQGSEEVLTNYLEEVARLDIENQNNKNFLSAVGANINSIVSKLTGKKNSLFFQGPPDVVSFIQSLSKSIKDGNFADLDIQAEAVATEAKAETDEAIIKESRTEAASTRVQEIYESQGVAGAFDIIQEFKPIVSKLVEKRKDAPNFDRQLLTDEIETGERGILDLIQSYKPEPGVPLAAYINKFLPARTIDASRRVLGKEFTVDVTEARGVVAEEVVVETPVKPEKKAIDPFRIMDVKQDAVTEVQENIADKDVDVTTVTYKELKDIAPYKTVAAFFNIPTSRISNPKDNLRKGDNISDIQRWILKNEPTLKNLFTEANREVVEVEGPTGRVVRKGGEPTGIPRNLLKTFYTKGKRVGNNFQWTLKPYNRNTFLESVGIKDGKVDPNFIPRSAQAQTMKGLLEMYARNLGNVVAREIVDADITVKPEVKARAKAEIAKGKPKLMFSETNVNNIINVSDTFNLEYNGKDKLLKTYGLPPTFKIKSIKDIETFVQALKDNIFILGPKAMFFGPGVGTVFTSSSKNLLMSSKNPLWKEFVKRIKELKNDNTIKYGKSIPGVKDEDIYSLRGSYKTLLKNPQTIKNNINKIKDFNNKVGKIHRTLWERINSQIKKDNKSASAIATYLGFVANDTSHWHKLGAQIIGYSDVITGPRYEYEHAMPATMAYLYLLDASLSNADFNTAYDLIIDNYKVIALDKAMDDKLRNARTAAGYSLQRRMPDNWSVINGNWWQRYFNDIVVMIDGGINPSSIIGLDNQNFQEKFNIDASGQPSTQTIINSQKKAAVSNNKLQPVGMKLSKTDVNQQQIQDLGRLDRAFDNARNIDAKPKGISIWDFDDTLATTKSNVLYTLPDGTKGKLTATQFAKQSLDLMDQGAEFDFSEFDIVTKGAKGPMFEKAIARNKKFGNQNVFILTARPMAAAEPIHKFLKSIGLDIPVKNIVGLADGTPEAKARWVVGKAAEGYNDFYFADDAYKNVKAVRDALSVLDVKSKVRQAYVKFSNSVDLDKEFNNIIEAKTGIASQKEYGRVKAQVAGAGKGRFKFFIPPSAEDFVGLLYATLAKGKLGDSQMAWYKMHLLDPYSRAMQNISNSRLALMNDYKMLKKQLKIVPKNLRKKVPGEPYTREQAVRVYIWNTQGMEVPGISKADLKDLTNYVTNDAELKVFADQLININKGDGYIKPKFGWPAGSITTDLLQGLNTTTRSKYLERWQQNVDIIFSEKNLNKLEAAYGKPYREALENMLQRMKTGRNRNFAGDTLTGKFTDWLTNSIGTIMFFNTRSALLQTISSINYINFSDNNPLAAAKAFANQKQYWSDFMKLMNSDFLKERRSGLRINVNEADIADMAKQGGVQGVISRLLELGFLPTQIADSFAIASGGATFYRNRIKTYVKQGMDQTAAEKQALSDWREVSEENQQSSRPDRISMQQAGPLGRIILAFGNTPMQYARLIKKAAMDLRAGRGDTRTNISKILYYGFVQNLIFNALQQAIFALAFGDEEPEDEEKIDKYIGIANGMADSLLRGGGIGGAIVSVGKNSIIRIQKELEKDRPKLEKVGYEITKLSPPISSKLSRINQAARSYQWDKEEMINGGWSLDNPAFLAAANVISALTNIPLDRLVKKVNNVTDATGQDLELWERLALLGGWQDWEIGLDKENSTNKPPARKTKNSKDLYKKIEYKKIN